VTTADCALQASFTGARSWASSTSPQDPSPKEPEKKDFFDHATGMEKCVTSNRICPYSAWSGDGIHPYSAWYPFVPGGVAPSTLPVAPSAAKRSMDVLRLAIVTCRPLLLTENACTERFMPGGLMRHSSCWGLCFVALNSMLVQGGD
jgi:hypothetical protein